MPTREPPMDTPTLSSGADLTSSGFKANVEAHTALVAELRST